MVDTFRAVVGRLSFACLVSLLVFAVGLATSPVFASSTSPWSGDGSANAMASCQASYGATANVTCVDLGQACTSGGDPIGCVEALGTGPENGVDFALYKYTYSTNTAPPNPCASPLPGMPGNGDYSGPMIQSSYTMTVPVTSNGATVNCLVNVSVSGHPVQDAYGHWHNYLTFTNAASLASVGSGTSNAAFVGVSGSVLPTQPVAPASPAVPALCGGGSCYNPVSNTYTAVDSSGNQFSVPGAVADSSSGGCASSGAATMCGGSPTPPSPVGTSGSTVTNPPTQVQSSDPYTVGNPSTGGVSSTTIAVYSSGGSTKSGAPSGSVSTGKASSSTASGDSGPASSSSSGNGDSFNGGGNCNTPPVCSGDAVMCGVAQEAWQTSCNVTIQTTAFAGSNPTAQPSTFASDQTLHTQSEIWPAASSSATSGNSEGAQANQGSYNTQGLGFSTQCPINDLTLTSVGLTIPLATKGCGLLAGLANVMVGLALFAAAKITAGGTD